MTTTTYKTTYRTRPVKCARAKRYDLQLPIQFREKGGSMWHAGTTENVSSSGVLFQSLSKISLNTPLELKFQVAVYEKGSGVTEICGRGVVVRAEQRNVPGAPVALAVAMLDSRIMGRNSSKN